MMRRGLAFLFLLASCGDPTAPVTELPYAVTVIIGPTGNVCCSEAYAINDSGTVVGWTGDAPFSGAQHAFRWRNGVLEDLGTLGGPGSVAFDINQSGDIVGWSADASSQQRTFLWSNGVMVDLLAGIVSSPYAGTAATINDSGVIAGSFLDSALNQLRAYTWHNGVVDSLESKGRFVRAHAINNAGVIAGSFIDSITFVESAALWTGTAIVPLRLPGDPYTTTFTALGLNDLGHVVGWGTTAEFATRGFHWNGSTFLELETLGGLVSHATFIGEDGIIVGGSQDASRRYRPTIWTSAGIAALPLPDGFEVAQARAINARGEIVGVAADRAGNPTAVVWRPSP